MSNKYETYFRDEEKKEKMILIPHVGAVNAAAAIALGLVARDDVEVAPASRRKHEPTSKRERESLSQYIADRELDGEKV